MSTRDSFPRVKRPGREADHSHPSSAEVKECVELYLHSPIRLHGVLLSLKKHRDFTFFYFQVLIDLQVSVGIERLN